MIDTKDRSFRPALVPSGTYEVEEIDNPFQPNGDPWIRICGTTIGLNANIAEEMEHAKFGDFQLQVEPISQSG